MLLQSDVPGSLRARAIYDCDEAYWQAWGNLMHSVATGEPAFEHTHGVPFFEYMKAHAAVAANFNTVMTDQNAAAAQAVVEAYDFSGLGTLVDVGGGHGSLLAAILAAYPPLRGILYDQPHVVAGARPTLEAAGVADRCDIIGGDFFERRARWRRCLPAEAHPPQLGRAALRGDPQEQLAMRCGRTAGSWWSKPSSPRNEPSYGKYLDLGMLVLLPGRERTEAEYEKLLEVTRFTPSRVIATRSELSILEAIPV